MTRAQFIQALINKHRSLMFKMHRDERGRETGALELLIMSEEIGDDGRWYDTCPNRIGCIGKILVSTGTSHGLGPIEDWSDVASIFGITHYNQEDEKRRDEVFKEALRVATTEMSNKIMAERENIVAAFVAETGCLPSECEQVVQTNGTQIRWRVQKRER